MLIMVQMDDELRPDLQAWLFARDLQLYRVSLVDPDDPQLWYVVAPLGERPLGTVD